MKGIKVITAAGIFVILTSIICFGGREVVYKKQIHFNSPEEVIEVLNTKTLTAYDDSNRAYSSIVSTDDFNECLSKRKRTAGSLLSFQRLNLEIQKECDENKIINNYKSSVNNFVDYKIPDNLKAYTLKGRYDDFNDVQKNITMDLVFIDDGEGYVIDYIMCSYNDNQARMNIE